MPTSITNTKTSRCDEEKVQIRGEVVRIQPYDTSRKKVSYKGGSVGLPPFFEVTP